MIRLTFVDDHLHFVFRRYEHHRRGVVEVLTRGNVIHIRPGFGGPMSPREVAKFKAKTRRARAKRKRAA